MRLPFDDLPRAVRERLVAISWAQADPRVLASTVFWSFGWWKYVVLAGGLVTLWVALPQLSHATLKSDAEVFLAVGIGVGVTLLAGSSIALQLAWSGRPYREGQWLFASGLVRLSGPFAEISPLAELPPLKLVHVLVNGHYSRSRIELGQRWFLYDTQEKAERALAAIEAARRRFEQALAQRDVEALTAVDPFVECTLSGRWSMREDGGPVARIVPALIHPARYAVASLAGFITFVATSGMTLSQALDRASTTAAEVARHRRAVEPKLSLIRALPRFEQVPVAEKLELVPPLILEPDEKANAAVVYARDLAELGGAAWQERPPITWLLAECARLMRGEGVGVNDGIHPVAARSYLQQCARLEYVLVVDVSAGETDGDLRVYRLSDAKLLGGLPLIVDRDSYYGEARGIEEAVRAHLPNAMKPSG